MVDWLINENGKKGKYNKQHLLPQYHGRLIDWLEQQKGLSTSNCIRFDA